MMLVQPRDRLKHEAKIKWDFRDMKFISKDFEKESDNQCFRMQPDPFFASFSFLFVRDTNLAHPIKNCSLHSLV